MSGLTPDQLVAGTVELASLPHIYTRVNEMMESPHYSALDIGQVIATDPALTLRILKIVNSAFYGFPSQIDTLSRAITVLGLRELRDLILATTVVDLFKGMRSTIVSMDDFWRHSICCGLAARALAAHRRELQNERFFVAGLLHDIGSLVMYHRIPELAEEALVRARRVALPLHLAERYVLGWDHAAVGGELLRKWKLPAHLQEAVAFHHHPSAAPHYPGDAAIVHLADLIADTLQIGNAGNSCMSPLDDAAWQRSGLTPDVIEPTAGEVERQYDLALKLIYFDTMTQGAVAH